jgi:FAD/FMN-containing dehydrogenase
MENLGVYIQPWVQGTSCHCEFNLYNDPAKPNELDKTKWMVNEGSRTLAKQGGFFSRPYGAWVDFAYANAAETVAMQRKVKRIFDPKGILNPGKLCL